MKTAIFSLAIAATLVAAQPHGHDHQRFHQKKSEQEKRELQTDYVAETMVVYKLGDKDVTPEEAKEGLANGLYIVVGETTPTWTSPAQPSSTAPATTSSKPDAKFFQVTTSSSSTSQAPAPTTSSAAPPASSSSAGSGTGGATGIDADFPSGKVSCKTFPSDYGALPVDWLGTSGWTSIQKVPNYSIGDLSISYIVAGVSGDSCTPDSFCSYACPAGYVKTQWPSAQGATGQSIGGLYCNSNGMLELTRTSSKTLCEQGIPGITIKNEMSVGQATCRTEYPGSEAMVIPLWTDAGSTSNLANIASSSYYVWQGKSTTLQYYLNQKGISVEDGCVWDCSAPHQKDCGNWAPSILGVGQDASGITYLSLFANAPTSTATLDFDVEVSGDIQGDCWIKGGKYYGGGSGCTTAIKNGGKAVITFKDSSS